MRNRLSPQDSVTAVATSSHNFQPRPFTDETQARTQSPPTSERFVDGFDLSKISIFPPQTIAVQPKQASSPQSITPAPIAIQRWDAKEHQQLGDEATRTKTGQLRRVQLAADYFITFGEMVAMAGDHFESIAQMRSFAKQQKGVGSREEIEYVRLVKIQGQQAQKQNFSPDVIKAADKRYLELARDNQSHFLNPTQKHQQQSVAEKAGDVKVHLENAMKKRLKPPVGAAQGYRQAHVRAIVEAVDAGRNGQAIDAALAVEAFGGHYLTDAFSAGHVRMPRTDVSAYWNAKVPMFPYNMAGFIAEIMAKSIMPILTTDAKYHGMLGKKGALETVTEKMKDKKLNFGDLVGLAIHDYENEKGIEATIAGQNVTLYGDSHLNLGQGKSWILNAVNGSFQEVEKAYKMGKAGKQPEEIVDALLIHNLFYAESFLPQTKTDQDTVQADHRKIDWLRSDANALLNDSRFQEGLAVVIRAKVSDLREVASSLDDAEQKDAFEKYIVQPALADPTAVVRRIVNWTPTTGGGIAGHNQDDNAVDYFKQAQKQGAENNLTVPQRINLLKDLLDGWTVGSDEDWAMKILTTAQDFEAKEIIKVIGWQRLHNKIDDGPGNAFANKFPKDKYAH